MSKYKVVRDERYDFVGVDNPYPPIHKYPATMISQVGIEALKELGVSSGCMLDPYCGSGSSFASGLEVGLKSFMGWDLNPLAKRLTEARFTKLNLKYLKKWCFQMKQEFVYNVDDIDLSDVEVQKFKNIDYWFSHENALKLQYIKNQLIDFKKHLQFIGFNEQIPIIYLFSIALATTMRKVSYTRNGEFKLYRIKEDYLAKHDLDAFKVFVEEIHIIKDIYLKYYHEKLDDVKVWVANKSFEVASEGIYDVCLTSPPYGDSATTVSYGQFSFFANQWLLDLDDSRQIDKKLMGGELLSLTEFDLDSLIFDYIVEIDEKDETRAMQVASFYDDLAKSIENVAKAVKSGGKIIYVVGNRLVKGVRLPTDQFVAEQFCRNGCEHLITYERVISGKNMPSANSPLNKAGETSATMNYEYIVMLEKE